jgi:hypothetical protein
VLNLKIRCLLVDVETDTHWRIQGFALLGKPGSSSNDLAPGQSRPYFCAFDKLMNPGGKILAADIVFESEYDAFLHLRSNKMTSDHFVLNTSATPQYWMQGIPLH